MYEEGSRKLSFNWLSLALKLVILAVFVFLLCWVFTRNASSSSKTVETNTEYISNITAMKEAAFEYFTETNLPNDVGDTQKLSLTQMVNQKLLIDFTNDGDKCDQNSSYVQATKTADGDYALKVSLDCNEKKDFIVTTIEKNKCTIENCTNNLVDDKQTDITSTKEDNKSTAVIDDDLDRERDVKDNYVNKGTSTNTTKKPSTSGSSSSSSSSASSSTSSTTKVSTTVSTSVNITISCTTCAGTVTPPKPEDPKPVDPKPEDPKKTLYYKHVKYSNWMDGKSYASNAENKRFEKTTYNYCKETNETIYTSTYVTHTNPRSYSYTLRLKNLDTSNVAPNTIGVVASSKKYFSGSDYQTYLNIKNSKPIEMVGNKPTFESNSYDAATFQRIALKSNNFTFSVGGVYTQGSYYYVDININVLNGSGTTPYYDSNLGYSLNPVPLKFKLSYALNKDCVRDTADNSYKYKGYITSNPKTDYYWMHRTIEYKWSTEKNLSGYEYTGISEYR